MERFILIVKTALLEHKCIGIVEAHNPLEALIDGLRTSEWKGWSEAEFYFEGEKEAREYIKSREHCWTERTYAGLPVYATYLSNHGAGFLIAVKLNHLQGLLNAETTIIYIPEDKFKYVLDECSD